MKRKILILELWGVGDTTFSTTLLREACSSEDEVHLVGKGFVRPLLEPTFPNLRISAFNAPWTRFRCKYHLWRWNWLELFALIWRLRKEHYDVAVSARSDPRDHLLMCLIGARKRYGFPRRGSSVFLTQSVARSHRRKQHKVEDWRDIGSALGFPNMPQAVPYLHASLYRSARIDALLAGVEKPVFCLHAGSGNTVRRWPVAYLKELIGRLRREFDFHLILIPDLDGFGSQLAPLADGVANALTITELVNLLGRSHLLLCNDSGPGHIAVACGRPVIVFFGPGYLEWFRPWGDQHKVVVRDICPHRPCFDYCRFAEPFCMTKLLPEEVWPEVREHLLHLANQGTVPPSVLKTQPVRLANPFVVVIIATYRRAPDLARMLESLKSSSTPFAVLVVDNANDPATEAVVEAAAKTLEILRLVPGENLGCGGGLAFGERAALERYADRATHFWMTDDDVVLAPGAMDRLLAALREEGAALACPMITSPEGTIASFPGLLEAPQFDAIRKRKVQTPEQYLAQFGPRPIRFSWATGVSLLVTRETLEELGPHRTDFLIRGEDFEFSLRITARKAGIYVPDARVTHYCYSAPPTPESIAAERKKQVAMLHNTAYISLHLPHGRRILRCLPGNLWRHMKNWGLSGFPEGLRAYWKGGVCGFPAGRGATACPMKLLVFAHTPPPHHGQSFMVQLMLHGFGGDVRAEPGNKGGKIDCYHVNCRVSNDMEDIGALRLGKVFLLLRYCLEAIQCRYRYGVHTLYYVPAPGKRGALYRDWIVMLLCRPFFKHLVLHWHAAGLSDWLQQNGNWAERRITQTLLGRPSLSMALAQASSRDAYWLRSRKVAIVPNGIADPCPEFDREILPCLKARIQERQRRLQEPAQAGEAPLIFRVFYIAHCTREKGLFDALEGVALFNRRPSPFRIHFTVAGNFMDAQEEREFRERIARPDLAGKVAYAGFAAGEQKTRLFKENDCLCFPTYYPAESFGLVILEAMAFGLPSATTHWHAIPEILPPDYPAFAEPQAPDQIADALERLVVADMAESLRARFLSHFSEASHLQKLGDAMLSVEKPG